MPKPYILGIGGTLRSRSSTENALKIALKAAAAAGADTRLIAGKELELPLYAPESASRTKQALYLVEEIRRADGIILGSPGYHGGISGLVKNALDYVEDLRDDERCYFDNRAVGSIATGAGWQGAVSTLTAMRSVVHALRGWNTPLGVPINTIDKPFEADGSCRDAALAKSLSIMGRQVVEFAGIAKPQDRRSVSPAAAEYCS